MFSVLIFIALHLIYGIIVGEVYQLKSPLTGWKKESVRVTSRVPETAHR